MLRLTLLDSTPRETVLRVEGWVAGPAVGVLEQEGCRHLRPGAHLTVDLAGVRYIDQRGLSVLRSWLQSGARLRSGAAFIQQQLQGAASGDSVVSA